MNPVPYEQGSFQFCHIIAHTFFSTVMKQVGKVIVNVKPSLFPGAVLLYEIR